ncbi:MAG: hypothetical protein AB8B91_12565 [Rubripirellula sp.]
MNDPNEPADDAMTLDPPGSIAVIGANVLGIEAALYGRYLGYDVTLIEAVGIEHKRLGQTDQPLPVLPARSLSPLARMALRAQQDSTSSDETLPTTVNDWIHEALIPLCETDLLRGRLRMPARVSEITFVAIEPDNDEEVIEGIPPDFRLSLQQGEQTETLDVEAVILLGQSNAEIQFGFEVPAAYLFQIGQYEPADDAEIQFLGGLQEVVKVFALLAGRDDLDLYRPRRE